MIPSVFPATPLIPGLRSRSCTCMRGDPCPHLNVPTFSVQRLHGHEPRPVLYAAASSLSSGFQVHSAMWSRQLLGPPASIRTPGSGKKQGHANQGSPTERVHVLVRWTPFTDFSRMSWTLLLMSWWPELGHMATSPCRRGWEICN